MILVLWFFSTGTNESLQMRKLHVEILIVEKRKITFIKLIENYSFKIDV